MGMLRKDMQIRLEVLQKPIDFTREFLGQWATSAVCVAVAYVGTLQNRCVPWHVLPWIGRLAAVFMDHANTSKGALRRCPANSAEFLVEVENKHRYQAAFTVGLYNPWFEYIARVYPVF